jgi:hypothetical protein
MYYKKGFFETPEDVKSVVFKTNDKFDLDYNAAVGILEYKNIGNRKPKTSGKLFSLMKAGKFNPDKETQLTAFDSENNYCLSIQNRCHAVKKYVEHQKAKNKIIIRKNNKLPETEQIELLDEDFTIYGMDVQVKPRIDWMKSTNDTRSGSDILRMCKYGLVSIEDSSVVFSILNRIHNIHNHEEVRSSGGYSKLDIDAIDNIDDKLIENVISVYNEVKSKFIDLETYYKDKSKYMFVGITVASIVTNSKIDNMLTKAHGDANYFRGVFMANNTVSDVPYYVALSVNTLRIMNKNSKGAPPKASTPRTPKDLNVSDRGNYPIDIEVK